MVRAPEYEEMDRARVDAMPRVFEEIFGNGEYRLSEEKPVSHPRVCGPITRSTYHIYKGTELTATIHQNGHIERFDDSIKDKLIKLSERLEKSASEAYDRTKSRE